MNIIRFPLPIKPRSNPQCLIRFARSIGAMRYRWRRRRELRRQNLSDKAIKGLLG